MLVFVKKIGARKAPGSDAIIDADPGEGGAMTTIRTTTAVATLDCAAEARVQSAASHLYDAEVTLHAAHQSHLDQWITAASDRLHEAVMDYRFAVAVRGY
jgi:hypothetical protein